MTLPEGHRINGCTDREALGLPGHYVRGPLLDDCSRAWRDLRGLGVEDLVALTSGPNAPFARRMVAGNLLALIGDPRIDPLSPTMQSIPAGRVRIGLDAERVDDVHRRYAELGVLRAWIEKESPSFLVDLARYRIGARPVTNREYALFLQEARYPELPTSWNFGGFPEHRSNHPVYSVTPEAADAYVMWLAAKTGRAFRLPTEAEWEHAAAGDERREFPWGDSFAGDCANTLEVGLLTTTPVGIYPRGASPFGVLDMAGNVEEYVAEDYAPYPGGTRVDDDLAAAGAYRVTRGGSFTRSRDLARCKRRHGYYPRPIYAMGFRLAETVTAPTA
jgi:toxoflavin biosynthesis protein ToxD